MRANTGPATLVDRYSRLWKTRALQVELGESAAAYVKAVAKILNQSGDAEAKAMISLALLGSWAVKKAPSSPLPTDLGLLVVASVLKSMLADSWL